MLCKNIKAAEPFLHHKQHNEAGHTSPRIQLGSFARQYAPEPQRTQRDKNTNVWFERLLSPRVLLEM